MDVVQQVNRFHLYQNIACHEQICHIVANQNLSIFHRYPILFDYSQSTARQLYGQRVLIDLLQKTGTESITNFMNAADNPLGNLIQL